MKTNEHDYYSDLANWSFENIDYTSEVFTNWNYEEEIKKRLNEDSRVLDLGTADGMLMTDIKITGTVPDMSVYDGVEKLEDYKIK